ncbi:MAG: LacI family transcriptional regulator [Lentisphaeria bacterium]|nr:LacI family transcriptional regulator [Lentisphaeria bacterium]
MPDVKVLANGNVLVSIPITLRESAGRKQIITEQKKFKAENDPIVLNIARGFYWQEMIDSGKITNIRELAKIMNVNESYVGRTIRLTMLSPEIIHRTIRGTLPEDISLAKLYKLPDRWDEQLQQLGIAVE